MGIMLWDSKMAQRMKVVATKSDDMSSVPGKGETHSYKFSSYPCTNVSQPVD